MNTYYLMNKDKIVAEVSCKTTIGETETFRIEKQYDNYLPYGFQTMNLWLENRPAAKHRAHIKQLMKELGCDTKTGLIDMTRCVATTDSFWVKRENDPLKWKDVSLYQNEFDPLISQIAYDGRGLYGKKFSSATGELSLSGDYGKCLIRVPGSNKIELVKHGSEGFSNAGKEPYSEVLAQQVAEQMEYSHAEYHLKKYRGKLASICPLFTSDEIGLISVDQCFDHTPDIGEIRDYYQSLGFEKEFNQMIIFDALVLNSDRHLGNLGFLVNNDTGEILSPAPLFDHNLSFMPLLARPEDYQRVYAEQAPVLYHDFISAAAYSLGSNEQAKLIKLKEYNLQDPGYDFPAWKLEINNHMLHQQIDCILRSRERNKQKEAEPPKRKRHRIRDRLTGEYRWVNN